MDAVSATSYEKNEFDGLLLMNELPINELMPKILPPLDQLPMRTVICQDALKWLEHSVEQLPGSCITSVPDICETHFKDIASYKAFFIRACELIMSKLHPDQVAIFYQTDIKRGGHWVDKAYLVSKAAENVGSSLLWHKIALISPPGSVKYSRPSYSHMLCFSKRLHEQIQNSLPDVLPSRGAMIWARGMGLEACDFAVKYCKSRGADCIVDPFCGMGSILAIANECGLKSVGVDLSRKRCRKAINLTAESFRSIASKTNKKTDKSINNEEEGEEEGE